MEETERTGFPGGVKKPISHRRSFAEGGHKTWGGKKTDSSRVLERAESSLPPEKRGYFLFYIKREGENSLGNGDIKRENRRNEEEGRHVYHYPEGENLRSFHVKLKGNL